MGKNRKKGKKKELHPIIVYTDGAADVKAKASGYGYVVLDEAGQVIEEGSGPLDIANNTFAELTAAITGIKAAAKYGPTELKVITDYKTIPTVFSREIFRWDRNGWKTSKGKAVKNAGIWKHLEELAREHNVEFQWVKGHSGNEFNSRCDRLAGDAMRSTISENKTNKIS